jgi:hypothetical protein
VLGQCRELAHLNLGHNQIGPAWAESLAGGLAQFYLDKTFVLFWGAYHAVSTVPYPVQGSQVIITPEKL